MIPWSSSLQQSHRTDHAVPLLHNVNLVEIVLMFTTYDYTDSLYLLASGRILKFPQILFFF